MNKKKNRQVQPWTDSDAQELTTLIKKADKPSHGIAEFARRHGRSTGAVSNYYYTALGKNGKKSKAAKVMIHSESSTPITVPKVKVISNVELTDDSAVIEYDSSVVTVSVVNGRIELFKRR